MPYTTPTATTFKARYPEFVPVADALVNLVLQEAFDQVGDTWLERDRARAQMLLAAHNLTMEGEPARTTSGQGSAGTGTVKRRKVGDVEVEFATPASSSDSSVGNGFASTTYGQQYLALMRLNFPAALAV
jgi:hypothetical protein